MNKPDINFNIKKYTPTIISYAGTVTLLLSRNLIRRKKILLHPAYLHDELYSYFKQTRNNWRKLHGKPMKRCKQLEKVKSFC